MPAEYRTSRLSGALGAAQGCHRQETDDWPNMIPLEISSGIQ
jgi:hypothetical protein